MNPMSLLVAVHDHLESLMRDPHPDAPGHCHNAPGLWNDDSPCDWCATWNRVRAAVKQHKAEENGKIVRLPKKAKPPLYCKTYTAT